MSPELKDETAAEPSSENVDAYASHRQLVWRRFRRHRLAMIGATILLTFYLAALLCEFVAPYTPNARHTDRVFAPPQTPRFIDQGGRFHWRPFVYAIGVEDRAAATSREYQVDHSIRYPLQLFVRGDAYRMWGLFNTDLHLFGAEDGYVHLLGTDSLGRDLFSRILYGARISLTIGLVGVLLTFVIGIVLGGVAGYFGGIVDNVVQRMVELLICIPQLPLWMVLSAAIPLYWPPVAVYFGITVILSFIGWTGLAREVRGKFLSLRDEDFVVCARLCGTSEMTIIRRHLLPSFMSHIIARATLAIPAMILGETALSFLGIGLRPPAVSWGVLLQDAQSFDAMALFPWLLAPAVCVVIVVLAFNMLGDGLRDAADPHAS
ncbi:ABC transporter permease [Phycisphaerales bacterium AB-hyl4]|uniref:ABC transporter permease n=1 Tax=Natronomicrosphaera hydrolytica TaxID=3242702 RepID=A0ABV4U8L7_9BACT